LIAACGAAICHGQNSGLGQDSASAAGQDTATFGDFPTFAGPLRLAHPAYRLIDLTPPGFNFRVTGMDLMSNGDLALVTISDTVSPEMGGGFGDVYLLEGARQATSNAIVAKRVYTEGFQVPLGLAVVHDSIFVSDLNGLQKLVDVDGDGRADSIATVFRYPPQDEYRWQIWNMSVLHSGNRFYTGLGAYHYVSEYDPAPCAPYPYRGTIHAAGPDGKYELIGSGLREPNGLAFGPGGELFATDNDGEWVPSNKLVHVRKNAFYGMCLGMEWEPGLTHTRPAIWFPELWRSPGQPVLMRTGPYRGQLAVGDYQILNLDRIFLEKVGGEYQGALFPFTGGMITGAIRLVEDGSGNLYLGEMEVHTSESWWYKGELRNRPTHNSYGLQKMLPAGDPPFEMLAVRATPTGFAIEFTQPAGPLAAAAASYRISQWRYEPTYHYGGPRLDSGALAVSAVSLSPDGMTANLEIPGLKADRVVYLQLHRDLRSRAGDPPWAYEAWYTLNAIPGREIPVRPTGSHEAAAAFAVIRSAAGGPEIRVTLGEGYTLEVQNLRGDRILTAKADGPKVFPLGRTLAAGVHTLTIRTREHAYRGVIRPF
jgi:hypothetical protein